MGKKTERIHERHTWVYFTGKDVTDKAKLTFRDGSVEMEGADPSKTKVEISHERNSGKKKTIATNYYHGLSAEFEFDGSIKKTYQRLCAVDTNYKTIRGKKIAVTAICACLNLISERTNEVRYKIAGMYVLVEPTDGINPERLGWDLAIRLHLNQIEPGRKVGLIVDSDEGIIAGINNREIGYVGNIKLPEHIGMIYATADRTDTLPNRLIRYCDSAASKLIKDIEKGCVEIPSDKDEKQKFCEALISVKVREVE